jgi:adenylate cyclase
MARLSERDIAKSAGTTVEQVHRLVELGILRPQDGSFSDRDISRVRVAEALDHEGISIELLGKAIEEGWISFDWVNGLMPLPVALTEKTYEEAADEFGFSRETIERLYTLWGLAAPPRDALIRADDEAILRVGASVFDALGRDEALLAAATRYFGENLRRIAESQVEFFKSSVLEPALSSGGVSREVIETASEVADVLRPAAVELVRWLHARHFETYVVQTLVMVIETAMEASGYNLARPSSPPAIAFLDLSGYTRLTEESGDQAAAELAGKLAELVAHASIAHGGRAVKYLGDGVMFHFADPGKAAPCGLDLVEQASKLALPAARMGANAGPVVFRDGDYFGRTINVAARVVEYARPREVLVTDDLVHAAKDEAIVFRPLGPVSLKGLAEPVVLHVAKRR